MSDAEPESEHIDPEVPVHSTEDIFDDRASSDGSIDDTSDDANDEASEQDEEEHAIDDANDEATDQDEEDTATDDTNDEATDEDEEGPTIWETLRNKAWRRKIQERYDYHLQELIASGVDEAKAKEWTSAAMLPQFQEAIQYYYTKNLLLMRKIREDPTHKKIRET